MRRYIFCWRRLCWSEKNVINSARKERELFLIALLRAVFIPPGLLSCCVLISASVDFTCSMLLN